MADVYGVGIDHEDSIVDLGLFEHESTARSYVNEVQRREENRRAAAFVFTVPLKENEFLQYALEVDGNMYIHGSAKSRKIVTQLDEDTLKVVDGRVQGFAYGRDVFTVEGTAAAKVSSLLNQTKESK